jgi:uncharacterized membrane protein
MTVAVRTPRRILLMAAVAVVAVTPLAFPYATLDPAASRIPVTSGLHYALLVAHIATASVALAIGPLQFVPRIRANRPVHRAIGRTYVVAVVLSALVGIPVAILSGRLLTQVGLTIPFVLWLVTAALAVAAIRRGDVAAHRRWMVRNYALTFLAITARVLVPLMLVAGIALGVRPDVATLIPVGQVAAWVLNLAIVEWMLARSR